MDSSYLLNQSKYQNTTCTVLGATGFIGRYFTKYLLEQTTHNLTILVRDINSHLLSELSAYWSSGIPGFYDRVSFIEGDLKKSGSTISDFAASDHIFHFASVYDMSESKKELFATNFHATKDMVDTLNQLEYGGVLHYISSTTVAGDYVGKFHEGMLDNDQSFQHPYNESKYAAEAYIRNKSNFKIKVYRPGAVVGHSETGCITKIDGVLYLLKVVQKLLDTLPSAAPFVFPKGLGK